MLVRGSYEPAASGESPAHATLLRMDRPLLAVILGTFTLRLSTGLTGGALVYYLNDLEQYGGPHADAITIATLGTVLASS